MMSWIEKHAFDVLLRKESASIKDMRPVDIPANQFSYHLNNLIRQGYIEKQARSCYVLTPAGLQLAGLLSTATQQPRQNMKTTIVLYGKTADGRVSLFEWSRQPYLNQVTLPHDRVGYDSTLDQAVATACVGKLGKVVPTKYIASAFIAITHQNETISRMHALIYRFNPSDVTYPQTMRNGQLRLVKPANCLNLMHGMRQFIQQLDNLPSNAPLEITLSY